MTKTTPERTVEEIVEAFGKFIEPAIDRGFDDGYRGAELDKAQKVYRDRYAWQIDMQNWLTQTLKVRDRIAREEERERMKLIVKSLYREDPNKTPPFPKVKYTHLDILGHTVALDEVLETLTPPVVIGGRQSGRTAAIKQALTTPLDLSKMPCPNVAVGSCKGETCEWYHPELEDKE